MTRRRPGTVARTRKVAIGLVIAGVAGAATPLALGPGAPPEDVVVVARDVRARPLADRIDAISAVFQGAPYVHDPAGEGADPDPDPPGRYDAFDCLSFVEEVLSLALAPDPASAGLVRHALRYGDEACAYPNRRHFMELQWLPGAVRDGWIRPVSASYGDATVLERAVDADFWSTWHGRGRYDMPDDAFPTGSMRLEILTLAQARAVAATIRPGTLLLIARTPRDNNPYWVAHLGFVLDDGGHRIFRDASRQQASMRVRDHDLGGYLASLAAWSRWPVAGIALFEPIEQGPPRRASGGGVSRPPAGSPPPSAPPAPSRPRSPR